MNTCLTMTIKCSFSLHALWTFFALVQGEVLTAFISSWNRRYSRQYRLKRCKPKVRSLTYAKFSKRRMLGIVLAFRVIVCSA